MKIREYINKSKGVKVLVYFILISIVVSNYSMLASAFEAHIINVTARICRFSETRTIGYWKNHPEVYSLYLPPYPPYDLDPICLGTKGDPLAICLSTWEEVNDIFENASADFMVNMLKAQLLAMKFNIAHFGVGGYEVEYEGETLTLDELVVKADDMLVNHMDYTREEKEHIKTFLDSLNNMHYLSYCSDIPESNYLLAAIGPALVDVWGCTDPIAINYDSDADFDDESCKYKGKDKDKGKGEDLPPIIDTTTPSDNEVVE